MLGRQLRQQIRRRLSFLTGSLSVFDLDGRLRDEFARPQISDDVDHMRGDWEAVCDDITVATERYRQELSSAPG